MALISAVVSFGVIYDARCIPIDNLASLDFANMLLIQLLICDDTFKFGSFGDPRIGIERRNILWFNAN